MITTHLVMFSFFNGGSTSTAPTTARGVLQGWLAGIGRLMGM